MIEAAVLSGGKDRELLVSLKNLKRFRMIHSTVPRETIDQYFIRYNRNKVNKEYSNAYKVTSERFEELPNSYYKPNGAHLKKPSKEAHDLQNKFIEKYKNYFIDKLGKSDRLNVKPITLHVDKKNQPLTSPPHI